MSDTVSGSGQSRRDARVHSLGWGEDKGRNVSVTTLPGAAASTALPFLLFFQDDANYLSGSLSIAQALAPYPPSGPGYGAHASRKISPNPTNCAEELTPCGCAGRPGVLLSLDRQWSAPSLGRDAGHG